MRHYLALTMGAIPASCGEHFGVDSFGCGASLGSGAIDRYDTVGFTPCYVKTNGAHCGVRSQKETAQICNVIRLCSGAVCCASTVPSERRSAGRQEPQILFSGNIEEVYYDIGCTSPTRLASIFKNSSPSTAHLSTRVSWAPTPSTPPKMKLAPSTPAREQETPNSLPPQPGSAAPLSLASSSAKCQSPVDPTLLRASSVTPLVDSDALSTKFPVTPQRALTVRAASVSTAPLIRAGPSPYRGGILSTFTPSPARILSPAPRMLLTQENEDDWELQQAIIASLDDQMVQFSNVARSPLSMVYGKPGNRVRELADGYHGSTVTLRHQRPALRSASSDSWNIGRKLPSTAPIMPRWIMQNA